MYEAFILLGLQPVVCITLHDLFSVGREMVIKNLVMCAWWRSACLKQFWAQFSTS